MHTPNSFPRIHIEWVDHTREFMNDLDMAQNETRKVLKTMDSPQDIYDIYFPFYWILELQP